MQINVIWRSNYTNALYEAEASMGMRSAEKRKMNVLEMKCFEVWWECHEWIVS